MTPLLGWLSSMVLLATLGVQARKQWTTRTVAGVSPWLYVGQVAASAGFSAYSFLVGNRVFTVTNLLGLLRAVVGVMVYVRNRREERAKGATLRRRYGGSDARPARGAARPR